MARLCVRTLGTSPVVFLPALCLCSVQPLCTAQMMLLNDAIFQLLCGSVQRSNTRIIKGLNLCKFVFHLASLFPCKCLLNGDSSIRTPQCFTYKLHLLISENIRQYCDNCDIEHCEILCQIAKAGLGHRHRDFRTRRTVHPDSPSSGQFYAGQNWF